MFHGVIQKITLAQFFLRHGVVCLTLFFYGMYKLINKNRHVVYSSNAQQSWFVVVPSTGMQKSWNGKHTITIQEYFTNDKTICNLGTIGNRVINAGLMLYRPTARSACCQQCTRHSELSSVRRWDVFCLPENYKYTRWCQVMLRKTKAKVSDQSLKLNFGLRLNLRLNLTPWQWFGVRLNLRSYLGLNFSSLVLDLLKPRTMLNKTAP